MQRIVSNYVRVRPVSNSVGAANSVQADWDEAVHAAINHSSRSRRRGELAHDQLLRRAARLPKLRLNEFVTVGESIELSEVHLPDSDTDSPASRAERSARTDGTARGKRLDRWH